MAFNQWIFRKNYDLLMKGPEAHKQRPHKLLETLKLVKNQGLKYILIYVCRVCGVFLLRQTDYTRMQIFYNLPNSSNRVFAEGQKKGYEFIFKPSLCT